MEGRHQLPVRVGETISGKYRIDRVIGAGGMGVVVQAMHLQLEQRVAIKFLLPDAVQNPEVVTRFAREARAAAKVQGEHIVRVMDVAQLETGIPYMVMEYLEGSDLSDVLKSRGQLPIEEAVGYVLEACEAVADAHAQGIVHRDLKPANLFLARRSDRSTVLKVLDFGISKAMPGAAGSSSEMSLTKTSAVMGSPLYMSPEQMRSTRTVDARTDIWALGVILYELLTRKVPFESDAMPELCAMILTEPPRPIASLRPDVPAALATAIETCLHKAPDERYQSVAELAAAIAPFGSASAQVHVSRARSVLLAAGMAVRNTEPSIPEAPAATGLGGSTGVAWSPQDTGKRSTRSTGKWTAALLVAMVVIAIPTVVLIRGKLGSQTATDDTASAPVPAVADKSAVSPVVVLDPDAEAIPAAARSSIPAPSASVASTSVAGGSTRSTPVRTEPPGTSKTPPAPSATTASTPVVPPPATTPKNKLDINLK
ncbi:MAG: protein kinase [Deltaproteobacteria bacterium]|nr:protein kinase [Deltaproteobacteria bacterium]